MFIIMKVDEVSPALNLFIMIKNYLISEGTVDE